MKSAATYHLISSHLLSFRIVTYIKCQQPKLSCAYRPFHLEESAGKCEIVGESFDRPILIVRVDERCRRILARVVE